MLAQRSAPGSGTSCGMPLGMSEAPLSKAELAQLDKKVQSWRKFKVGREVVKKVGKNTVRSANLHRCSTETHKLCCAPAQTLAQC